MAQTLNAELAAQIIPETDARFKKVSLNEAATVAQGLVRKPDAKPDLGQWGPQSLKVLKNYADSAAKDDGATAKSIALYQAIGDPRYQDGGLHLQGQPVQEIESPALKGIVTATPGKLTGPQRVEQMQKIDAATALATMKADAVIDALIAVVGAPTASFNAPPLKLVETKPSAATNDAPTANAARIVPAGTPASADDLRNAAVARAKARMEAEAAERAKIEAAKHPAPRVQAGYNEAAVPLSTLQDVSGLLASRTPASAARYPEALKALDGFAANPKTPAEATQAYATALAFRGAHPGTDYVKQSEAIMAKAAGPIAKNDIATQKYDVKLSDIAKDIAGGDAAKRNAALEKLPAAAGSDPKLLTQASGLAVRALDIDGTKTASYDALHKMAAANPKLVTDAMGSAAGKVNDFAAKRDVILETSHMRDGILATTQAATKTAQAGLQATMDQQGKADPQYGAKEALVKQYGIEITPGAAEAGKPQVSRSGSHFDAIVNAAPAAGGRSIVDTVLNAIRSILMDTDGAHTTPRDTQLLNDINKVLPAARTPGQQADVIGGGLNFKQPVADTTAAFQASAQPQAGTEIGPLKVAVPAYDSGLATAVTTTRLPVQGLPRNG